MSEEIKKIMLWMASHEGAVIEVDGTRFDLLVKTSAFGFSMKPIGVGRASVAYNTKTRVVMHLPDASWEKILLHVGLAIWGEALEWMWAVALADLLDIKGERWAVSMGYLFGRADETSESLMADSMKRAFEKGQFKDGKIVVPPFTKPALAPEPNPKAKPASADIPSNETLTGTGVLFSCPACGHPLINVQA